MNVFSVAFDQFKVPLLNKSITLSNFLINSVHLIKYVQMFNKAGFQWTVSGHCVLWLTLSMFF